MSEPMLRELFARYLRGDADAFSQFFRLAWPIVYDHAKSCLRIHEDAEDVAQQVLFAISRQRSLMDNPRPYLQRCVRNEICSRVRKKKVLIEGGDEHLQTAINTEARGRDDEAGSEAAVLRLENRMLDVVSALGHHDPASSDATALAQAMVNLALDGGTAEDLVELVRSTGTECEPDLVRWWVRCQGYTAKEVAAMEGCTPAAVDASKSRFGKRLQ